MPDLGYRVCLLLEQVVLLLTLGLNLGLFYPLLPLMSGRFLGYSRGPCSRRRG